MSDGFPIADATQDAFRHRPDTPKRPTYTAVDFRMQLVEIGSADGSTNIILLEPGKQYRVKVWTEPATAQHEKSVFTTSPRTLWLTLKRGNDLIYEVQPMPQFREVPANATQFQCEFDLLMPDALPDTDATLCLAYEKSGVAILKQPVKLAGTYNPIDTTLAEKCRINPAIERPEKTAFLYVSKAPGDREISLVGWGHYKGHTFTVPTFEVASNISLGNFISGSLPADVRFFAGAMIGRIEHFFTYSASALTQWLDRLYDQHGKELVLIITDLTDYEVPWELYPFSGDRSGSDKYLGANISVVRWGVFRNVQTKRDFFVSVCEEHHVGQTVAYIDPFENHLYDEEKKLLQRLANRPLPNNSALYQKLEALHDTGMVYIGSHGTFVHDEIFQTGLGHRDNPTGRILLFKLSGIPACHTKRPVFFVNACNSARWHRVSTKEYLGLHEVILANFASAYIGTSGPVNAKFTLEVAQFILPQPEEAAVGISLARRLRDFRAQIVTKYLGEEDEKVLYAFMYVYYGNPLAYLHLSPAQIGEVGDD
ncbi:MAG: hypothetical protein IPM39_04475 [Chloroflexi bacterium]|nr:hypothetical protein [Chloroflexota bacterium]